MTGEGVSSMSMTKSKDRLLVVAAVLGYLTSVGAHTTLQQRRRQESFEASGHSLDHIVSYCHHALWLIVRVPYLNALASLKNLLIGLIIPIS